MSKKLTQEEVVKRVKEINPNIEIIGEYINSKAKIKCKCLVDGYEWCATPNHILRGKGCPKCAGNIKITTEEYIIMVNSINPNIEVKDEYINALTKIKHKCKLCGNEWMTQPNIILSGHGCPVCAVKKNSVARRKNKKDYITDVYNINSNIEVIGEYVGTHNKILHHCKICGNDFLMTPHNVLSGQGCPKCGVLRRANSQRKTQNEYIDEVANKNLDIDVIGKYINCHHKILHRCKICNYEWRVTPADILSGKGCPNCNISKGENIILNFLYKNEIKYQREYKFNDCKNKNPLPFDFYLPYYNICIEYDGKQHFQPIDYFGGESAFESQKERDNIKTQYCKENNIKLLRIPYWEFENIEIILNKELLKGGGNYA